MRQAVESSGDAGEPCSTVSGMRRTARLSLALLIAVPLLTGCSDDAPLPSAPPPPSAEPVFASDEEALAAAEEAYGAYSAVADQIMHDGGKHTERLAPLVSPELFEFQNDDFENFKSNGWRSVGTTTLRNFSLQQVSESTVVIYVCVDISDVDVVDADGNSHVSPDRPNANAHEATLEWRDDRLIVVADEQWTGGGVC